MGLSNPKLCCAILLPALCLAAASRFTATELQDHRNWMDDAQDKKEDLREALAAKDARKLLAAAQATDALTAKELAFWARTEIKQAQELAAKNREESRELVRAATASRLDSAGAAFASLERTCSSCHDLHFEKNEALSPGQ